MAVCHFQKSCGLILIKMKKFIVIKREGLFLLLLIMLLSCISSKTLAMTGDSILFSDPDIVILDRTWAYDPKKAVRLSDAFFQKAHSLTGYRCTMRNFYDQKSLTPNEWFELSVRYPTAVRIDLFHPRKGAVLIYRKSTGRVRIKPFSFLGLQFSLSPRNSLLVSKFGHTIDHADFRSFSLRILKPACMAHACVYLGKGTWKGVSVDILNIAPDALEAHRQFGRMLFLVDGKTGFPVMIETISPAGDFLERIEYGNCEMNISYPKGFFKL